MAKDRSIERVLLLALAVLPVLTGSFLAATAQVDVPARASLGVPFTLAPGGSAEFEGSDIYVKFIEVTEDSRCPSDVVCIWAGQVSVSVNLFTSDSDLGTFALTLGAGNNSGVAEHDVEGFKIKLLEVQPYPVSTQQIAPSEYRASLLLSKADSGSVRSVLVMALASGDANQAITKFITAWSIDRESGVAIFVMRDNSTSLVRIVAKYMPSAAECVHAGAECIDGQITSITGSAGIGEGDFIHLERDSKNLYVSFKAPMTSPGEAAGEMKEYVLDVRKFKEVSKPGVPHDGGATTITMTEGQREGPLLVQKIYPDRVEGLNYPEYPIAMDKGLPITLYIGDKASNGCTVILTLVKIDNGVATFQKHVDENKPCPICWLQLELMPTS